ncbi:hypothetical protein AGMMS49990_09140 [Endomicrobiia bacterium]|nr:hypothetical protein AGMMS49990_09140 [Endomicrobiia bacterium]
MERKDSDNGHNVKSESASNVDPIEREKTIRKEIESETYGPNILPITYVPGHFWYKSPRDSYVYGDCALYAVVRCLHHAGQLGIVDEDLWTISNQELRNILADKLSDFLGSAHHNDKHEKCRRQGEWLFIPEIFALMSALGMPDSAVSVRSLI